MYSEDYIKENIKIPNWGLSDAGKRWMVMMVGVCIHNQQRFGKKYFELEFPIPEKIKSEFNCNTVIIKIEIGALKFERW
jgi:hypothetical protein